MKKLIAIVLALVLLLTAFPFNKVSAEEFVPPATYVVTREYLKDHIPNFEDYERIINQTAWSLIEDHINQTAQGDLANLPWLEMSDKDFAMDYLNRSFDQFVNGNFTDNVTILGTSFQVTAGVLGVDFPMDIRDITADFYNWEWSAEHLWFTTIDLIALVPMIGTIKQFDEAIILAKGGDDALRVLAKRGGELAGLGDEAADGFNSVMKAFDSDAFKNADKLRKIKVIKGILEGSQRSDEAMELMNGLLEAQKKMPNEGFLTFLGLKNHLGSPGPGMAWHHIIEQSQALFRGGFGFKAINNVNNIIAIPEGPGSIHRMVSAIYSTCFDEATNFKTLRNHLADFSKEEQLRIGLEILMIFGEVKATKNGWVFTPYN